MIGQCLPGCRRGIVILVSLMVAVFVFVLTISVLSLIERDYRLNAAQELSDRAYYAARAGLMFERVESELFIYGTPPSMPKSVADADYNVSFTVSYDPVTANVTSQGLVCDRSGNVMAQRTLLLQSGHYADLIDESQ